MKTAKDLGADFRKIGRKLGMKVEVLYSKGEQPVGNGIGPSLEAADVMKVLECAPDAPKDLRNKSIEMAGILLELCGKARKRKGAKLAQETLDSGKAHEQMLKIIKEQGPVRKKLRLGEFKKIILAKKSGKIKAINNKLIAHIARSAGAPKRQRSRHLPSQKIKATRQKRRSSLHYLCRHQRSLKIHRKLRSPRRLHHKIIP